MGDPAENLDLDAPVEESTPPSTSRYLRWERYCNDLFNHQESEIASTEFNPKTGEATIYSKDGTQETLPVSKLIFIILTAYAEQKKTFIEEKAKGIALRIEGILKR